MAAPNDKTQDPASEALKWDAVDAVLEDEDFLSAAAQLALSKVGSDVEAKKVRNMKPSTPALGQFDGWRARMQKGRTSVLTKTEAPGSQCTACLSGKRHTRELSVADTQMGKGQGQGQGLLSF